MKTKHFVVGSILGAAAVMVTGFLMFSTLFPDFYARSMSSGAAVGVQREAPLLWAAAAGSLAYGMLITLVLAGRPAPVSVIDGVRIGALVGFLVWLTADFMFYAIADVADLTTTMLAPVLELVPGGIAGGVIAWVSQTIGDRSRVQLTSTGRPA